MLKKAGGPPAEPYAALDLLATMVAVVRPDGHCLFANSAFESVLGQSRRTVLRGPLYDCFVDPVAVSDTVAAVARNDYSTSRFDGLLRRPGQGEPLPVHVIVNQMDRGQNVIVEMVEIEQQTRQDREERLQDQVQANKELIRNLVIFALVQFGRNRSSFKPTKRLPSLMRVGPPLIACVT